jgi:molecular chaperone HtpG
MTDPVDEWVVQDLREYGGKPLRSVSQGDLDLGGPSGEPASDALAALVERAKAVLGDRVKDVRPSRRLVESAACLVDDAGGLGRNMERLLRMSGRELQPLPRILELNPGHAFVKALDERVRATPEDADIPLLVELLLDQAHLADGDVPTPAATVKRIQALLDKLA